MDLPALGLMLRGATFGVAVAAAVAVVSRHREGWPPALAAFAIGGIAAFIAASLPGGIATLGPVVFARFGVTPSPYRELRTGHTADFESGRISL